MIVYKSSEVVHTQTLCSAHFPAGIPTSTKEANSLLPWYLIHEHRVLNMHMTAQ